MKYKYLRFRAILLLFLSFFCHVSFSQEADSSLTHIDATLMAGYAGSKGVPFWLRSNQYGSVPEEGTSTSLLFRVAKSYNPKKNTIASNYRPAKWDWGYAIEERVNIGSSTSIQLIEANVKVRWAVMEAKLGRSRDVMGFNGDTVLSSGNFSVSGNALGIPVLDFRFVDYYRIPILGGLFSFKGNFANGYLDEMAVRKNYFKITAKNNLVETLYHQKSLYGRLGRSSWRLNLFAGFNHQVQFGNERKVYGKGFALTDKQALWHVILGKSYGSSAVPRSKIGNHQGSIDLGFTYDFPSVQLMGYRQNIYDVGALSKLANIKDGLNGLTLRNNKFNHNTRKWDWKTVLVEFFYSKDQAGYPWSIPTKSGDEDYYNNFYYMDGWSYKGMGLGTPLIITESSAKKGQAHYPVDFFISNRVVAGHVGVSGRGMGWLFHTKWTLAKHYGTFGTSEFGKSTDGRFGNLNKDQFVPVTQFSGYIQAERLWKNNTYIGFTAAGDIGKMFDNSVALQLSIRKCIGM